VTPIHNLLFGEMLAEQLQNQPVETKRKPRSVFS
jgi:hypothetical protein